MLICVFKENKSKLYIKVINELTMCPIKSLFIPCVELNIEAYFIMDLFYENSIATIKRVTFENYGSSYKRAYVDIYEWHDSEIAYNFIQRLKNEKIETKLVHSDDNWWVVKVNYKKESFYLNETSTFENYLVSDVEYEDDKKLQIYEELRVKQEEQYGKEGLGFTSNKKGMELLSYLNGADMRQDIQDWKEIEDLINTSLKCFGLEFSY